MKSWNNMARRAKKNKKRKMRAMRRGRSFPKCKLCGTGTDLDFDPDPFDQAVNSFSKRVWLCRKCREKRKDDI